MSTTDDNLLKFRIYSWTHTFEKAGFEKKINQAAKEYLENKGVDTRLLEPLSIGMTGGEALTGVKFLVLIYRITSHAIKLIDLQFTKIADTKARKYIIDMSSTANEEGDIKEKSNAMSLIGYDLKCYLEEIYKGYYFTIKTNVSQLDTNYQLSVSLEKTKLKHSALGRVVKVINNTRPERDLNENVIYSDGKLFIKRVKTIRENDQ